jgi:hypothetical protein
MKLTISPACAAASVERCAAVMKVAAAAAGTYVARGVCSRSTGAPSASPTHVSGIMKLLTPLSSLPMVTASSTTPAGSGAAAVEKAPKVVMTPAAIVADGRAQGRGVRARARRAARGSVTGRARVVRPRPRRRRMCPLEKPLPMPLRRARLRRAPPPQTRHSRLPPRP